MPPNPNAAGSEGAMGPAAVAAVIHKDASSSPERPGSTLESGAGGGVHHVQHGDSGKSHMDVEGSHEHIVRHPEHWKAYVASVMTLTLAVFGGSILPLPWAFSQSGVVLGPILLLLVAAANSYTSDLLIRQCYRTGSRDFEELALTVGGRGWLMVTESSILVLLLGNTVASIQQSAEAAVYAVQCITESPPAWLLFDDNTGYFFMGACTLLIIFPLCLLKQLRSMEYAGAVSSSVLVVLAGIIVAQSVSAGLPALKDGSFPVAPPSLDGIAQAVSVLGYGFYLQPLMLPLLQELPGPTRSKARILTWAMRLVVLGFAAGLYFTVGFFGAAWYGNDAKGNILQNELLGGGIPQGVLNFAMAVHVSLTTPILVFCSARILMTWTLGNAEQDLRNRTVVIGVTLFLCLQVAMFWHTGSAKILVLTGATGVMMTSYVCPIVNHFLLYFGRAKCQLEAQEAYAMQAQGKGEDTSADDSKVSETQKDNTQIPTAQTKAPSALHYRQYLSAEASFFTKALHVCVEVILPWTILKLGVILSLIAIYAEMFVNE